MIFSLLFSRAPSIDPRDAGSTLSVAVQPLNIRSVSRSFAQALQFRILLQKSSSDYLLTTKTGKLGRVFQEIGELSFRDTQMS